MMSFLMLLALNTAVAFGISEIASPGSNHVDDAIRAALYSVDGEAAYSLNNRMTDRFRDHPRSLGLAGVVAPREELASSHAGRERNNGRLDPDSWQGRLTLGMEVTFRFWIGIVHLGLLVALLYRVIVRRAA
jgi:hypothetical protein